MQLVGIQIYGFISSVFTFTWLLKYTYLQFITPLVYFRRQIDAIYLLRMLCSFTDLMIAAYLLGYVNWFRSPLTNTMSPARCTTVLALVSAVKSCVPQGTVHLPPLSVRRFARKSPSLSNLIECVLAAYLRR